MRHARLWLLVAVVACSWFAASGHEQNSHTRQTPKEEPGHRHGVVVRRRSGDEYGDRRGGRYVELEEEDWGREPNRDFVRIEDPYYGDDEYAREEEPVYVVESPRRRHYRRVEIVDEPRRHSDRRRRVLYVPRRRNSLYSDLEETGEGDIGSESTDRKDQAPRPRSDDDAPPPPKDTVTPRKVTPRKDPSPAPAKTGGKGGDGGLDDDVPEVPKEILEASKSESDEASFLNGDAERQAANAWGKGIDVRIDGSDTPAISRMGGTAEKDEFAPVMCSDGGRTNVKLTISYAGNVVAEGSDAKNTGSNLANNILVVSNDALKEADDATWTLISSASEQFGIEKVPEEATVLSVDTETGRNYAGVFQPTTVKYSKGHEAFFHTADGVNTGWVSMKTNNLDSGAYYIIFCHRGLEMYRCVGGAKFTVEQCAAKETSAKGSLELMQMDMDTWRVLQRDHVSPEDMKVMRQIDEQFSGTDDSDLGEDSLAPNITDEVNAEVRSVEDGGKLGKTKSLVHGPKEVDLSENTLSESTLLDGDSATEDMPILHVSNKGVLCQTGSGNKCGEHVNVIMFNPQVRADGNLANRLMLVDPSKFTEPSLATAFISTMKEVPVDKVNLPSSDAFKGVSLDKDAFIAAVSLNVGSESQAFGDAGDGGGLEWSAVTECLGPNYCLMNVPVKLIESMPSDHRLYLMLGYTDSDDYSSTTLLSREAVAHLNSPDQPLPSDAVVKDTKDDAAPATKDDPSRTGAGANGGISVVVKDPTTKDDASTAGSGGANGGISVIVEDEPHEQPENAHGGLSVVAEKPQGLVSVTTGVDPSLIGLGDLGGLVHVEAPLPALEVRVEAPLLTSETDDEVEALGSVQVTAKREKHIVAEEVSEVAVEPLVEEVVPEPEVAVELNKEEAKQEAVIEKVEEAAEPPKPKPPVYNVKASRGLAGSLQQESRSTLTRGARDKVERKEAEAMQSTFAVTAKDSGDDMLTVKNDSETGGGDGALGHGEATPKGGTKPEVVSSGNSGSHDAEVSHEESKPAEETKPAKAEEQKTSGDNVGACKSEVEGDLGKYEGCMDAIHSVCKMFAGEVKDQFVKQGDDCVKVGCTFKGDKSFLFVQKVDGTCASHSELPVCTEAMNASTDKTVLEGCQYIEKVSDGEASGAAVGFKDLWESLLCNVRHSGKDSASYVGHYSACFKKYDSGSILIGTDQPPSGGKMLKGLEVET